MVLRCLLALALSLPVSASVADRDSWLARSSLRAMPDLGPLRARDAQGEVDFTDWGNLTLRYKKVDICETTEGVNSYSGYVDLGEESHTFFWFFEARNSPETAPITLWLNGGPGSDSLI